MDNEIGNASRSERHLRRALSARHVQMLAFGGVIGVGLFYGATVSVRLAGPSVILDFVLCGVMVAIVMRALGEMTVADPSAGSFAMLAKHRWGDRLGFVTAGMWWFYWVATVMSELAAIGKLIQFWAPNVPAWLPGLIALALFTLSNLLIVRMFGEIEYWFAVLKALAIAVFIVFGLLMMATPWLHTGGPLGIANLYAHGGFLPNGWLGAVMALSLVVQAYSGIETLGVEAAETANPKRTLQRAFRSVTWRVLVVYIGSMFVMLCAFPWTYLIDHNGSPYALMFARAGIPIAAGLVNLVIVCSGLSSCNTGLYGGSRMLYAMARQGHLSSGLARLNRKDVPHVAVWLTSLAIGIGILITYLNSNYAYVWITSASAFASLWTWFIILLLHVTGRRVTMTSASITEHSTLRRPILSYFGMCLLVGTFVFIVLSPLTRVSVFSGVVFLLIVWIYALVRFRGAKGDHDEARR
ncbi:permease [Alicyclobacillus hesperidum subsp. aegles]|uniref:amino acid permease n=1 Tax=Alicyclobacillus hesperidum TaxID=89784 RepID=UPI0022292BFA|nr:amino acid permease [Alicyclobacillus hesperidum]GLG01885.1 permease [Alicyclobacillus hesperidum subsp. aegles]